MYRRGAQKPTGKNLKVVAAEFSTLSQAVFVMSVIAWRRQARPHLELKTQPWFCPVSSSLSKRLL
jgi:hypothetical protein